ncbi:MAG TPA: hypothetical protein VKY33_05650 [Flavobacterium sp.]|nr:hypothetical protein [Flavobacterium sp.]
MKDKVAHFIAAFVVLSVSMAAITYMFYGKIDWVQTIIFGFGMGLADVFIFKKLRERKK